MHRLSALFRVVVAATRFLTCHFGAFAGAADRHRAGEPHWWGKPGRYRLAAHPPGGPAPQQSASHVKRRPSYFRCPVDLSGSEFVGTRHSLSGGFRSARQNTRPLSLFGWALIHSMRAHKFDVRSCRVEPRHSRRGSAGGSSGMPAWSGRSRPPRLRRYQQHLFQRTQRRMWWSPSLLWRQWVADAQHRIGLTASDTGRCVLVCICRR